MCLYNFGIEFIVLVLRMACSTSGLVPHQRRQIGFVWVMIADAGEEGECLPFSFHMEGVFVLCIEKLFSSALFAAFHHVDG